MTKDLMSLGRTRLSGVLLDMDLKVSYHVGRSPTGFYKIMGRRCSHVFKRKPLSSHIFAVC